MPDLLKVRVSAAREGCVYEGMDEITHFRCMSRHANFIELSFVYVGCRVGPELLPTGDGLSNLWGANGKCHVKMAGGELRRDGCIKNVVVNGVGDSIVYEEYTYQPSADITWQQTPGMKPTGLIAKPPYSL